MVVGCNDAIVYIYSNNGVQFTLSHILTDFASEVQAVDITADGEWLLVVEYDGINRIYIFNPLTNQFQLNQTITIDNSRSHAGALTDDHLWLVLTNYNDFVYIYTFNGSQFVHKETLNQFPNYVFRHLSLTNDHLYMAFVITG